MDDDIEIYFGKMEVNVRNFSEALKEFNISVLQKINEMKISCKSMGENEEWTGMLYEDFNNSLTSKLDKLVGITNDFASLAEKLDEKADLIAYNMLNFK